MHFSRELHELACYLSIYPVIHLSNLSIHPYNIPPSIESIHEGLDGVN